MGIANAEIFGPEPRLLLKTGKLQQVSSLLQMEPTREVRD